MLVHNVQIQALFDPIFINDAITKDDVLMIL